MPDLTSPGRAASSRSKAEISLSRVMTRRVGWFFGEVSLMVERGELTVAAVSRAWGEAVESIVLHLPEAHRRLASAFLFGSSLPDEATEAASAVRQRSMLEGWSASRLRREVRRVLNYDSGSLTDPVSMTVGGTSWRDRVQAMSRTTSTALEGDSRLASLRAEGFTGKKWVTRHDSKVRPAHAAVDGHSVPLEQPFHVGNSTLMYPADPNGLPEDTMNCRCVIVAASVEA